MNIYDKIQRMPGTETYEQKMYQLLNTEHYTKGRYRHDDMGEGMALVWQLVWSWWKPRFLLDHTTQCAYEIMNTNYELVTVTDDDIDWNSMKDLPDNAITRARNHNAMFPTLIRHFENGQAKVEWQINPDGKYYMDDDGFGMTSDNELTLFGTIDRTGKIVKKFVYEKSNNFLLL